MTKIARGQVWDVNLNPATGAEIQKIRPCVVVSADQMGRLPLKVVVPITAWNDSYAGCPWLVRLEPDPLNGLKKASAADTFQVKSLSTDRFVRQRGVLSDDQVTDIVAAVGIVIQIF